MGSSGSCTLFPHERDYPTFAFVTFPSRLILGNPDRNINTLYPRFNCPIPGIGLSKPVQTTNMRTRLRDQCTRCTRQGHLLAGNGAWNLHHVAALIGGGEQVRVSNAADSVGELVRTHGADGPFMLGVQPS
ncbi:hypothetical protein N7491_011256 [Penicillium cf. griseofulvum]|nr:hypothetical protein N7491_011256 [Penicillium cf. griseofulvum]